VISNQNDIISIELKNNYRTTMKFSAVILVASFGSAAAATITLEKNRFSVNDQNVVVEFNYEGSSPQWTDWIGIFDENNDYKDWLYTCGTKDEGVCSDVQAQEEGTVVFVFKAEPDLLKGTYAVCLMKDEVIGQCHEIELVGKKKSPIKIKKKISMYDPTVKVKFNNPDEPRSTNWVGFYDMEDDLVQRSAYTCGSDDYEECENESAPKKGKVVLSFLSMQAGKYNACLMDDKYDDKQIGKCQKITVYNPDCKTWETKEECKWISSCTWKKNKDKCKSK